MPLEKKKPKKVLSISGREVGPDVLDDLDFEIVADLQAEVLRAQKKMDRAITALETRILHGAVVRARSYYFDAELRIVRSRKGKAVSE